MQIWYFQYNFRHNFKQVADREKNECADEELLFLLKIVLTEKLIYYTDKPVVEDQELEA